MELEGLFLLSPVQPDNAALQVYAYKKKQICASELYFMQPAFARDTEGEDDTVLTNDHCPLLRPVAGDHPAAHPAAVCGPGHVPRPQLPLSWGG